MRSSISICCSLTNDSGSACSFRITASASASTPSQLATKPPTTPPAGPPSSEPITGAAPPIASLTFSQLIHHLTHRLMQCYNKKIGGDTNRGQSVRAALQFGHNQARALRQSLGWFFLHHCAADKIGRAHV